MKITPFFRWYDLWIGMYIDTKGKAVYICLVPMIGIKISYRGWPRPVAESEE
jgi:hypothetical protein